MYLYLVFYTLNMLFSVPFNCKLISGSDTPIKSKECNCTIILLCPPNNVKQKLDNIDGRMFVTIQEVFLKEFTRSTLGVVACMSYTSRLPSSGLDT